MVQFMASKYVLKARQLSARDAKMRYTAFKVCFQFQVAPVHGGRLRAGWARDWGTD